MAGTKPEQEPSIEEILASIRQIISDDDEPRKAGDIELPKDEKFDIPLHAPDEPTPEPTRPNFAEVLDLTNEITEDEKVFDYSEKEEPPIPLANPIVEPVQAARVSDFDFSVSDETARKSEIDLSASADDIDALFSTPAADATTQAFAKLIGNIPVEREENKRLYADGRITLEDITKDLLRPMLRQWVDENVPRLVERLVEKELEKLSRQVRD